MSVTIAPVKPLNPVLATYLSSLATRPILTKSSTSALLSFISEIVAGHIAGCPAPPLPKAQRTGILPLDVLRQNHRALKLAAYGFFVAAPMGHTLLNILQKVFAGKTSGRAKLLMILCSNIFISPIQQSVYIAAMAVIGGANTPAAVFKAWKMSFWSIMRFTWVVSTVSMALAQKTLDPPMWVPFFTLVGSTAGCFINVQTKKKQLALRAKAQAKADAEKDEKKST